MLHTKYQGRAVSDKNIFKVFNLKIYFSRCDLDMQLTIPFKEILKRAV